MAAAVSERNTISFLLEILIQEIQNQFPELKEIKPIYGPQRDGDIPHSLASLKKVKTLLNYRPTHNLKQGIQESIEWYIKYFKKN